MKTTKSQKNEHPIATVPLSSTSLSTQSGHAQHIARQANDIISPADRNATWLSSAGGGRLCCSGIQAVLADVRLIMYGLKYQYQLNTVLPTYFNARAWSDATIKSLASKKMLMCSSGERGSRSPPSTSMPFVA